MKQFTPGQSKHKTGAPSHNRNRPGSVLVETVIAMVIISVVGLVLFKGAIDTLAPRQWALVQNISDAYLTFEKAYAERIPFKDFTAANSPWPVFPNKDEQNVVLGTLPGGQSLSARVIRTRKPDSNNLPAHGGSGTLATNPAEMQVWTLQSLVLYEINGREYVKTRTIVRSQ